MVMEVRSDCSTPKTVIMVGDASLQVRQDAFGQF